MARVKRRREPGPLISDIEQVSPPKKDKYDWSAIADQLRERPGVWFRIYRHGRASIVPALIQGKIRAVHPDLGFEFTTTDNTRAAPRTCTLFMRWNPDKADPVAEAAWFANNE